jgi:hypothetical protein
MTLGQIAYEAYREACPKSLNSGAPRLGWEAQADAIKQAWQTAADAVMADKEGRSVNQ